MANTSERPSVYIERSEKRKVIIENPNEVSCRSSTTVPAIIDDERAKSTVITMRPPRWFLPVLAGLQTLQPETKVQRMHKVPVFLRDIENHKGSFEPMAVSIGPYHHGEEGLIEVEKVKALIAGEFIGKGIEKLNGFEEVAHKARACYYYNDDDNGKFNHPPMAAGSCDNNRDDDDDDKFTRMMFLDGCFILHFIRCVEGKIPNAYLKTHQINFVLRDLFLLENQLPFPVLEALMNIFKDHARPWEVRIQNFVTPQGKFCSNNSGEEKLIDNVRHTDHLLHLLHKTLSGVGEEIESPPKSCFFLLIEKIQKKMVDVGKIGSRTDDWHTFRSVTELKTGGIKFEKSDRGSLKDVKFELHPFLGKVFLPHITIDDFTRARMLNLVAYEACPDGPSDSVVTSYICFLDALIDSAEDVKELRSKRILRNLLGNDEKVAELFNELATHLGLNSESEYRKVMDKIEKYHRIKCFKWAREICSTHFRSPWTGIAFVIGAAIVLLTFVQTYFSVFPKAGSGEEDRRTPKTPSSRKIHFS